MRAKIVISGVCAAWLAAGVPVGAAADDPPAQTQSKKVSLDISAQPMGDALNEFAHQAGLQVVFYTEIGKGLSAPRVSGSYTAREALERLLANTGLHWQFINAETVAIRSAKADMSEASRPVADEAAGESLAPRMAQVGAGAEGGSSGSAGQPMAAEERDKAEGVQLEEIVVTGTNIRGATNAAAPVYIHSREDIHRSGASTVQQFVQWLPQNFNGGASENTIGSVTGGGSASQGIGAAGVNLRGLGNDSTLVLVNGRRLAPANTSGNFVDISMIPLSAVDRIEVLPDGASAIYGSDAVGGVINFILQRDFEGAETSARYGAVTSGNSHELQASQALGHAWANGSALLAYEYFERTPLFAKDREIAQDALDPMTLMPSQRRNSVLLSATQRFGANAEIFADAGFSDRSTFQQITWTNLSQHQPGDLQAYNGTVGWRQALASGMTLETSASYGVNDTRFEVFNRLTNLTQTVEDTRAAIASVDAKLDGTIARTRAGTIRFALGGQYRKDSFDYKIAGTSNRTFDTDRGATAGFLELNVPLVAGNAESAVPRLELSAAGRFERYDQFGSTSNPKVGLAWNVVEGFKLRGTYGTSFKAPLLNDTNPTPSLALAIPLPDPAVGGSTNSLVVFGGNPGLEPEEAKTWTAGFDVRLPEAPQFTAKVTYYSVKYENRIIAPNSNVGLLSFLASENLLGSAIIQRGPTAGTVQGFIDSAANFINFGVPNLATIGALVDTRSQNLSQVTTDGFDFDLSYGRTFTGGAFETGISGTRILDFENRFTDSSPELAILDTPYNPLDLRLRGRATLEYGNFAFAAFVNHADSYEDKRTLGQVRRVDSWTTVDMTGTYTAGETAGLLSGTTLTLGVVNLFDREPPFVFNPFNPPAGTGIHFDGANANALGRLVHIQLSHRW